jgi:hypothetical protein
MFNIQSATSTPKQGLLLAAIERHPVMSEDKSWYPRLVSQAVVIVSSKQFSSLATDLMSKLNSAFEDIGRQSSYAYFA